MVPITSLDIVYCLKCQFARHGLPMEVVSDNILFNSAEFRNFAQAYDFKHTRSSPHYAPSNGKAESAVKQAKRLMEKALEDEQYPFLALLAYRNTPSEQLHLSPTQIMFGRRTRTHLPATDQLLAAPYSNAAHSALVTAKDRQAFYYNRSAREKPPHQVGDRGLTVRTRWKTDGDWQKGTVVNVHPYRSYDVQFEDGSIRRRTSKHVRFSREPPLVARDEIDRPSPPSLPPAETAAAPSQNQQPRQTHPISAKTDTSVVTRSGRQIRKPAKLQDYDCR